MLRSLLTILSLGAGSLFFASPKEQPPSSLEHSRTAQVTFAHVAKRVIACGAKGKGKDLKCEAEHASADATTSLTLSPVGNASVSGKDKREPVTLSFPKTSGQPIKVALGPGVWEMAWPGRNKHDRFVVAEGDEVGIRLVTEAGACKRQKDDCILTTDRTLLRVVIPKECQR